MNDDTQPRQPINDDEENQEDEESSAASNRLNRLMGAKDRTDKEAAHWSEIEQQGTPVPSQDQPDLDMTQPHGSTRPDAPGDDQPASALPPSESKPAASGSTRPAPFPHPTDRPLSAPSAPPPPGQPATPRSAETLPEPPQAPRTDPEDLRRGVRRPGGQQHERYQPSSVDPGQVRLDSSGMPLPRRAAERRVEATAASETVYSDPATEAAPYYEQPEPEQPTIPPPRRGRGGAQQPSASRRRSKSRGRGPRFSWGCLGRIIALGLIVGLVLGMLGGGGAAIYYSQVTAPSFENINGISDLQQKALQFQTTRIRDSQGTILYEINDPNGGRRQYVTIKDVSPWIIVATVATEEREFFTNPGFSVPAIARAVYQGIEEGRAVSGASTITQQLTRALLLPEEERTERSYQRKIKEIFLAAELGRRFTKTEILELYLNQIYYGNLAYGIEAASQTYFNKSAKDLTLAEASFLAGLPQSPAIHDPVNNKEGALARQQDVLALMIKAGCLNVGDTGIQVPCVTQAELDQAAPELQAIAAREFHAPASTARYPHWVVYVQQQLEQDEAISRSIYTGGYDVYTTLDPRLQDVAQSKVELVLSGLTERNVNNGSAVVINSHTGAILAMVGSRDFNDESIDGQVNVALTPQQPGSSIKPFTYLTAFRQGWNPATVIWDVPIAYEIPGFGLYEPQNYDGKFHGPVPVRTALANSYNIPAVLTLDHIGVPALLETLNDVGIDSLGDKSNPQQFGLSLTLGAGEVYLLDWTNAYATLANGGQYHPTYAIERIEKDGKALGGYPYQIPEAKQVVDANLVYLLTSILSDQQARIPAFGTQSVISPPYPAAAKTGTTNDFRDNWTMGYTTEIAVGVWVGNTDNSPMIEVTGVTGAGPIWRGIMDEAQQWYPAQSFPRPAAIDTQTICGDDGALPSAYCQEHASDSIRQDIFGPQNRPPAADQGLYRQLKIDQFTGLIANDNCKEFTQDKFFVVLPNPSQLIDVRPSEKDWLLNTDQGKEWATRRGIPLDRFEDAPIKSCQPGASGPTIEIASPKAGTDHSGALIVTGTVDAPDFAYYTVDFGLAEDPIGWGVLQGETPIVVHDGKLGELNLAAFEPGPLTIRVTVYDKAGHHAERRVTVRMIKPTRTPGPTDAPTATTIPETPTEPPTLTPVAAATDIPTDIPTPTTEAPVLPTETPTP